MYKVLRKTDGGNPNPIVVTPVSLSSTSKHVTSYLLCSDCEQRFNQRGESWMLGHCYREDGSFRLRELLFSKPPAFQFGSDEVYSVVDVPELSRDELVYFGASVFWRAAIHEWRMPTTVMTIKTDLGPYEDDLRMFLLDKATFPDRMMMSVRISSLPSVLAAAMFPDSQVKDGYRIHKFTIPGVEFVLSVGSKIPQQNFALCTARSGFIIVSPDADNRFFRHMVGLVNTNR